MKNLFNQRNVYPAPGTSRVVKNKRNETKLTPHNLFFRALGGIKLICGAARLLPTIIPLCLAFFNVQAQGWERTYGSATGADNGASVQQTADGGYIIAGTYSLVPGIYDIYLIKTDAKGDTLWTKTYGGANQDNGTSIQQTNDGGYIITGYTFSFGAGLSDVYLIKTDANGDTLWTKTFGGTNDDLATSVRQTADKGYIITGWTKSFGTGLIDVYLIKTNVNGDTLWTKTFGGINDDGGGSVQQTTDKGYIITGWTKSFGAGSDDVYLIKTDSLGDTLWTKTFGGINNEQGGSVQQTADGGFIITGTTNSFGAGFKDVYVIKTDVNGDTLWTKTFGGIITDQGSSIQQTTDGGYIITGNTYSFGSGSNDVYLIKTNVNGDTLWTKILGGISADLGRSVQQTTDGGYIITGTTISFGAGNFDVYLIKTDSLGNSFPNIITGTVFADTNQNCIIDSNEFGLSQYGSLQWLVKIEPGPLGNPAYYTIPNSNGVYSVRVDTGTYTVSLLSPSDLWSPTCPISPPTYTVSLTTPYDTAYNNDFGNKPDFYCPELWLDLSSTFFRPCLNNTWYVNYCNNGTAPAINATIDIEFPNEISPVSSTNPWVSQSGNVYTFNIGTLNPGQCGTFNITSSVSCNAVMNQTLCATARIFPDTICTPIDSAWDRSSVEVEGACVGDSLVCFTIYNTGDPGTGDMDSASAWRLYEDNILAQTGTFQLTGGDSLVLCFTANDKTLRLEADQRPGHPGSSRPRESIELCGDSLNPSLGQIILIAEDDADDNKEIYCGVVITSFDPNDKQVKPVGLTANRYIKPIDELEYQVRFQNTGNDTAFLVRITDTLPTQYLDMSTFKSGASSHPYTYKIYGQGIIEWTFSNINLVDSTTNEPGSHGFVKFKVRQKPNNAKGTVIKNRSSIYFDFNAPVITNTVFNTIWDTTLVSGLLEPIVYDNNFKIIVFPNPFKDYTEIKVESKTIFSSLELILIDITGKEVKRLISNNGNFKVYRTGLPEGMYIFRLLTKKKIIGAGKLIVND